MVGSCLLCLTDERHKYAHVIRADCFNTPDDRADDGNVHENGYSKYLLLELAGLGVDVCNVDMACRELGEKWLEVLGSFLERIWWILTVCRC